ncbi:MAG: autotransporter-associated beta strand repeat-containing protein [Cyclobacteriaceae bacterium]|nr:autotransporter-associated beta strand repeat-containing protein [Cyclobacteriaceae bacterium]
MLRFLRPFHALLTVKSGKRHKIGLLSAVFIILVFTLSFRVNAQTWVPAGGGNWNTAANWSPAVVPGAGADVIIPATHTGGTITGVPTISLNSLTVSGSGNCVFSASVSGNLLTVTGSFSVASGKTFTIGAAGARMEFTLAATATGVIDGNVVLDAFTGGADRFFTNNGDLTISPGATLSGVGESNFVTSAGSTLRIGSPQGITLTTMTGSVQMTGSVPNRVYSTGANYIYVGNANQAVGDGLPATVASLTINNSGGGGNNTVTLASSIAISNGLFVSNGVFALGANNVTTVSSLEMSGTSITGTGTITLAGDVTTNASATTALISAPIALGGSLREFKVADGVANPDLSISSIISGTGGVRKGSSGVLFLSAANTFTGGTVIESGTLRLGNPNALNSGAVTFTPASTGILQLNGNSTTVSALNTDVVVGTPVIENGGGPAATLTVNSTGSSVFAGTIQNGGAQVLALTKSNSGALTLSGTNTYSGGTSLTGGTLNINSASAIGTGSFAINAGTTIDNTSSGAITLTTNNTQNWNGDFTFTGTQNLNVGTGAVTLSGNRQVTTAGGILTVGGVISGGFRLTKAGAGTLTLSGANLHSGTTLSSGTLNINSSTALGSTSSTFIINGGTIDNTTSGAITTGDYPQSWAGDFVFTGTQDLNLGTGAVTLTANRQITTNAGNLTVGGIISGGFGLSKSGAGALTLTAANAFTGGTTLNAGTLNINNAGALGTVAGTFTINGGTINNTTGGAITTLNYPQNWNGDFTFTGTQNLNLGTGTITLSANRLVTVNANTLAVRGIINAPSFNLTKAGGGTLALGSNPVTLNSLAINSGTFTSTSGTLTIGGSLTNSGTFNNNNGTVLYNGASPQTVAGITYFNLSFSGAGQKNAVGTVNVTNNLVNTSVFDVSGFTLSVGGTINNTGGTIRFSGVSNGLAISTGTIEYYGSGQLVAAGTYENLTINQSSGEAQLSGDITVNGVLTISNGNLNLAGFNLTLGPSATISIVGPSSSKMIIATGGSEVKKIFSTTGSFTFPIGDNTGALDYSPVTVNVTAGSGFPAELGASVQDIKHPSNASTTHFLTRYWNITTTISGAVATVTATYPSVDINGTETSIKAARLTGSFNPITNPWVRFGNLAANTLTASGSIASGQVSSFTGITGADPSVIITGGGVIICAGGSVNLLATPAGDAPFLYDWAPAAGLSATTIANPVASPAVTTLYTVTITDGNGITANANTTITVEPNPTPSISGVNSVCAGQTGVVYSTTNNAGNTYLWEVSGGTIVGAATNNSVTIDWGVSGSGWVRVTETITATSCSTLTPNYTVTINPNPSPAIGGPATACANESGLVYSTALVAGNTYAWSVTGGSITSGAGTNSITVTWGGAGTGTVQVTQTVTATGCATTTAPYNVTINPNPTPTISGPITVCANQAGVGYNTPFVAGNTYSWVATGGSIIGSSTNNTVTIDWGSAGTGTLRVAETNSTTGCTTLSSIYNVTINPNPTPVISGPNTVCANQQNVDYTTPSASGRTYLWVVTGGTIDGSATNSTVRIDWGGAGTGTLTVTETITATGCAVTTPVFDVTKNPLPTGTAVGPTALCVNATGLYSTANTPDVSYNWIATGGGTIVSGQGTPDAVISWATTGAKQVRVVRTDIITGCSFTTPNVNVTVNPNPTPVISGANTVCELQSGVTYSTPSAGGRAYVWTVTGGTIVSGAGTASIQVNWGAAGTGLVELTETITATGCTTVATPLNVTINPSPTPVISGSNTVCAGAAGVVYSTPNVVGNSYSWIVTGGTIVSGGTTNSITVDWGAAGSGSVTVVETILATGCSSTTPSYIVTINPNPTPVISGANTVCAFQNGVIYSTPTNPGRTYNWTVTGGTIVSGAGTASIQVNWGAAGTGTVGLTEIIDATGCSTIAANLTVIINPIPTPVVTGTTTVCANQSGLNYSSPNVPGNIYIWSVLGGTITAGGGTNSITVTWGSAGPGSVTLIEFIPTTGCVTTSAPLAVTINANPAPFITGDNTVCANELGVVYSTPFVAGNTYSWTVAGGVINGSSTGNSIIVDWGGTPGTGTVQLVETVALTGCSVTTPVFNVTINPAPAPVISGSAIVCANQSGEVYSTPNTPGNVYNWTVSGGTIVSGIGTNSIVVDWGGAGAGTITLTEFTPTGCAVSATPLSVTINPTPAPAISGNNTVCANDQDKVYNTPLLPGRTYAWVVTGGTIDGPATGNSIVIDWGGAGTGTIQLTETIIATGCFTTTPVFNVNINPIPTPVISGAGSVCANETGVVYSTPNVPGNSYTWTVVGGSIVAGAGTNSITVNWGAAGTGSVTVTEFIPASSCSVTTPSFTVIINPIPSPVVSGDNTVCEGATAVTYSTPFVAGNTYNWLVTGGTIVGPATSNTVTVDWGVAGSGSLQVTETVGSCSVITPVYPVTIYPNPSPVISGTNSVCSNQAGVVYSTPNVIGNTYSWEVVGGSITAGTGTNSITVTWAGAGTGSVKVTETIVATGCAVETLPLLVTISPSPIADAGSNEEICQGTVFNFSSQSVPASAVDFGSLIWTTTGIGTLVNASTLTPTYSPAPAESGVITFTLTATGTGACPDAVDVMQLTITPLPVVNAGSSEEICQGTLFDFNTQTTPASASNYASLNWTHTGTGTLFNASTLTPTYLPNPAEVGPVTFTLEATSTGSCSPVTGVMTLTITPAVAVNAGSNEETCAGIAFNFISQATPATATNYSSLLWSTSGTGTLTNATTLTPSYTPGVGEVGNVTFTLTAFGNGSCPDKTSQMTLSITPAPTANAGSNEEICEGLSFSFSSQATPATGGNFSSISWSTTGSGTIFNGNTLTPLYVPSSGETGTITFTLTANGSGSCLPVNSAMNLTITPKPVVNAGSDAEVCQTSSIDFGLRTTPASASAFSSVLWTTTGSGTLFNATTLSPTYVPGVGESGTLVFTLTANGNGSCVPVIDQMNLTVTPPPVVNAGSNEQICQGSFFDFSAQATPASASNISSLLWTTTGTGTLFSANTLTPVYQPASGETGTITFTLTGNGLGTCTAVNSAMQLTITPAVVVNAGSDAETCEGTPFDFSTQFITAFALNFSSLQWTTSGTGTISGSTTLTPVYTPGVGETGLVTFTLTAFGNGVCPSAQDQMVLSITPGIIVDAGSNEEICQGSTFSFSAQSIPASAVNVASVFWTHTGSGSLFNANTLTPTYFASPAETGIVTFTLTGFSSGSCSSINDVMQLTITPAPVAIAGNNDAVCEGTPTFDFASRTSPASFANGTVLWTHTGAGTLSSNTVINPVYTVHPSDVNTTITFTLTVTSPSAVCSSVQSQFTLNVNRAAVASVPLPTTVCEPQRINLSGTIGGSASSGAWSLITGGGTLSVSSITGLNVTAVYDTIQADVGTSLVFRLTAFDPDGAGPCTDAFADYTVTIEEAPKVFAGADFAICEYEDINLNGSFSGSATSVTWSGGVPAQFGNINNPVTSYTLNAAERAATNLVMTFTLTTNDPPGVCGPVNDQVIVAVRDTLNSVLFTGVLKSVYAENDPAEDLTFAAVPIGGVFSGPGISGMTFFPSIANITPQPPNVITYTYQDPATGCFSAPKKTVVVNPITLVNFRVQNENPDPLNLAVAFICNNQGELILIEEPLIPDITALIPPESAVFSSTNPIVNSRITFDVSGTKKFRLNTDGLPPGVYPITYTFTNSLGASNPVTRTIRVTASPKAVIDAGNCCEDIDAVMLESSFMTTPNPYGATLASWFWEFNDGTGSTNTLQEPTYRFPGDNVYPVTLRVTTNEGCYHDTIKSIRIGPVPKVNFSWSEFCQGDDTQFNDLSDAGISTIIQNEWQFGDGFIVVNNYPIQTITDAVPPAQSNAGRTSGTFKNPRHRYDVFGQKNVRLIVLTNDGCLKDTTITVTILDYSTPTPVTSYFEDFELGQGSWFSSKANQTGVASDTSWVFGLPTGNVINSAASGINAWWTGSNPNFALNQDKSRYYNNERSAIIGPCLDLTNIKRPMISLDYWADSEVRFDGAVLQYSTDGGINWSIIGDDSGPGINWYNGRALTGNPGIQPLGQFGWTDRQQGWKNARHNLDQIPVAERGQVIFRIAFGSNNDNGTPPPVNGVPDLPFDGFAFDNIFIGEKQRNVLVEYFTNSGISPVTNDYLNNLYNNQFTFKDSSDFFKIQYHIGNPDVNDPIYQQNKIDPDARKLYYLIQSPPVGIMDGIVGDYFGTNFNGDQTKITAVEVDRRALEDSVFTISIQQLPTSSDSIKADVTFRYVNTIQPLNIPVRLYIGLVETNLAGNINVLRKMLLGNEGKLVSNTWVYNTTQVESIRSIIDIPIGVNNPNLYLVAWVQDNATKRIHQARIVQSAPKSGSTVVGIEDDPVLAAVKDIFIYPNPASKQFNFAVESSFTKKVNTYGYTYSIVDQRGVVVSQGQLKEDLSIPQEVDIAKLANGMYVVIISKGGRAVTQRKLAVMNRH